MSARSQNVAEKSVNYEEVLEMSPTADAGNSSDEEAPGEDDTTATKMKSRHDQEQEYDEPDEGDAMSDHSGKS